MALLWHASVGYGFSCPKYSGNPWTCHKHFDDPLRISSLLNLRFSSFQGRLNAVSSVIHNAIAP